MNSLDALTLYGLSRIARQTPFSQICAIDQKYIIHVGRQQEIEQNIWPERTLNMTDHDLNMTQHENISILQEDFRAAMFQAVTEAGAGAGAGEDPKNPETGQLIKLIEKKNAAFLEKTRICMSGKNSIPGFRQVVILSPELSGNTDTGWPGIIAVTSDGRLVAGTVRHGNPDNKKPIAPIQVIDSLQAGQSGPEFSDGDYSFIFENSDLTSMYEENIRITVCHDNSGTIDFSLIESLENNIQIKVYDFLTVQMKNRINMIRHVLFSALDENVSGDMQESNLKEIEYGYWLTGGDGASENVVIARQQAIRAYPALAKKLYFKFSNTIDAREPLSPVIARYYDTSERKLKRIQGLTLQYIGADPEYPDQCIKDIFNLSDNNVPKNQQQFRQLNVIREFGRGIWGIWNLGLSATMRRLPEGGDLWRLADRMEQTSAGNVLDSVNFLVRKLLVPVEINKISLDKCFRSYHKINPETFDDIRMFDDIKIKARDQVLTHFSARELLDLDQRYHRNIAQYEDRLDIITVKRDWPGMLDTIDLGNGCIARELTSSAALKIQGRAEDHCVGGYVSRILSSKDHSTGRATMIFSIEQDDQILSTAEINCFREFPESGNPEQLRTEICQNKARSNTSPSRVAEDLAKQVAARVQQAGPKAFQTYLDGLHEACAEHDRISDLEYHIAECGLDPYNRVHLETAWENLGPALPKRFRRNGLDALIRYGMAGKPPGKTSRTNRPDHGQSDRTGFSETDFPKTEQEGILEYDGP